eukprot:m.328262 g.328262  ORF g.328262 m.328262 type:complete len:192 (+) comp55590_c0_seq19:921-1496(+)
MICSLSTARLFHLTWGCTRNEQFEVRSILPSSIFLFLFAFTFCLSALHLSVPLLSSSLSLLVRVLSGRNAAPPTADTIERSSLLASMLPYEKNTSGQQTKNTTPTVKSEPEPPQVNLLDVAASEPAPAVVVEETEWAPQESNPQPDQPSQPSESQPVYLSENTTTAAQAPFAEEPIPHLDLAIDFDDLDLA